MQYSYYRVRMPELRHSQRIAQISDVHFSKMTDSGRQNDRIIAKLQESMQFLRPDVILLTGDLVSREMGKQTAPAAVRCMRMLLEFAPVLYTFGNHETDLSQRKQDALKAAAESVGVTVLNNRTVCFKGVNYSGYVLPQECYKNPNGSYFKLKSCQASEIYDVLGVHEQKPTVLLAHNPMGLPAYAKWGADLVLSGHVHGGIVRMPFIGGILSPERKFFPKYTKGMYSLKKTRMIVSAGIGKLRIGNPPEVVCVDLVE